MGARQSKRSVDITATPKRTEGEDQPLEGKLEKIEERDLKPAANGATAHSAEPDIQEEEVLQNGAEVTIEEVSLPKSPEADTTLEEEIKSAGDEKEAEKEGEKSVKKEKEKKDKVKKKWSFRSISFSKKDKSKPARDEGKNGDLTKEGATAEPLTEANEEKPESSEGVAVASEPEAQTQKSESAPEADATLPPKEVESIEKKDEGKAEEKIEVKAEDKIEIKAEEKEEEKTEVKSEEPVPKTEELKEVPASPVSAVVEEKGAVVIVEVANVVVAALSEEVPPPLPASPPPVDTAPVDSLPTEVSPPLLDSAPATEISVETVVAEMVAKVTQEEPVQAVPKVVEEVKDAAEQSLKEPVAIISEAVKEVLDTVEVPPPVNEVVKVVETAPTPVEETPAPVEPTPTSEPALIAAPEPTEVLVNKLENGFPEPELGQQIIDEPIKKSEDVKSSASEQVSQIQESVTVGNDSTESSKPRTPVEE